MTNFWSKILIFKIFYFHSILLFLNSLNVLEHSRHHYEAPTMSRKLAIKKYISSFFGKSKKIREIPLVDSPRNFNIFAFTKIRFSVFFCETGSKCSIRMPRVSKRNCEVRRAHFLCFWAILGIRGNFTVKNVTSATDSKMCLFEPSSENTSEWPL